MVIILMLLLILLQSYPDLVCQTVYSTFCEAFPTSWRQYNDTFKTDLTDLVTLWMTGMELDSKITSESPSVQELTIVYSIK